MSAIASAVAGVSDATCKWFSESGRGGIVVFGNRPHSIMPKEAALQLCIYCDSAVADTRDHVPPKLLLPKPWTSDLITVPACRPCNAGFQPLDEYFRATLGSRLGVDESDTGVDVVERLLRALDRPGGRAISDELQDSVTMKAVFSEDGMHLGEHPALEIDSARIDAVLKRIVRGLYWHETRQVMPGRVELRADYVPGANKELAELLAPIIARAPSVSIGSAFRYQWRETSELRFFTAWLLTFYGTAQFAVFTVDPAMRPPEGRSAEA